MGQKMKQVAVWGIYSFFLFVLFKIIADTTTAVLHTLGIVSIQVLVIYSNLKWILPIYYAKNRYLIYGLLNLLLLVLGVWFNDFITDFTPYHLEMEEGLEAGSFHLFDLEMIFTHAMPIILALFVSLFIFIEKRRKRQEQKELEMVKAEKMFLVQQTNPHFLFNTLNNIYFLTYKHSPKGSQAIMQLSKMLDYSLYGGREGVVSVTDEIKYITNFISLYKLRDSSLNNISFDSSSVNPDLKIAPMLLIPFIENAFKYANLEDINDGFITINLYSHGKIVVFSCVNSKGLHRLKQKRGGIGIVNVKRRLDLFYPDKYKLAINDEEKEYTIKLELDTDV